MDAKELYDKRFRGLQVGDITSEMIQKYAIDFAKLHVKELINFVKDNVTYGIYQNDDCDDEYHHESSIYVDFSIIDTNYSLDEIN